MREARGSSVGVGSVAGIISALVWPLAAGPAGAQEVIELPAEDRWLEPVFEEVYRVGSLSGEDWEQFGNVHTVAFDAAGRLHVFDKRAVRVVVVDVRGGFVHEFGQQGEGSGDFRDAAAMAVLTDGRVVVGDTGHRGYSVFDANGIFLHMVRMGGDPRTAIVGTIVGQPGQKALVSQAEYGTEGTSVKVLNNAPLVPDTTRTIERIDLAGEEITSTTIAEAWLPPLADSMSTGMVFNGVELKIPRPLASACIGACYRTGAWRSRTQRRTR